MASLSALWLFASKLGSSDACGRAALIRGAGGRPSFACFAKLDATSLALLQDGLGSVTSLSDPAGAVGETYTYDSYGKLASRLRNTNQDLCYAGGVALNSVANERIVRKSGFRKVFIMPAAEDSGTAIGAAYYGLWQICGYSLERQQMVDSMGHSYGDPEISSAMDKLPGLSVHKSDHIEEEAADLLSRGKIVGWFQGGSELGPRALGQRSILCDPRPAEMKDILNKKVKFREAFRPFAPILPEEDLCDWFDTNQLSLPSPFMLRVLPFRRERASRVPAVVHVDGTGRVQTVSKDASPQLYRLLTLFKQKTGTPVLLNTSFNVAGEPIVETPADALWCFLYTDMDYCILGDYVVSKTTDVDYILDWPISLNVASLVIYGAPVNVGPHFEYASLEDAGERVFSGHLSRIEDLGAAARVHTHGCGCL